MSFCEYLSYWSSDAADYSIFSCYWHLCWTLICWFNTTSTEFWRFVLLNQNFEVENKDIIRFYLLIYLVPYCKTSLTHWNSSDQSIQRFYCPNKNLQYCKRWSCSFITQTYNQFLFIFVTFFGINLKKMCTQIRQNIYILFPVMTIKESANIVRITL